MKDLLFRMWIVLVCFQSIKGTFYFQTAEVAVLNAPQITFLHKKHSGYSSWEWLLNKVFPNNQYALMKLAISLSFFEEMVVPFLAAMAVM